MSFFWIVTLSAFTLSFTTKLIADAYLHERIALIGSFVGLLPVSNPGIAFGVRLPNGIQEILIVIALVLVFFAALRSHHSRADDCGYGLIVGGAVGNVLDRLFDGFVTDFFQIGSFAIFNVADSCITIGVALLLAQSALFFCGNHVKV